MKLVFSMFKSRQNYTKPLTVSEGTLNIKAMLLWTFFIILLTSRGMAKQRILLENEIGQNFQN